MTSSAKMEKTSFLALMRRWARLSMKNRKSRGDRIEHIPEVRLDGVCGHCWSRCEVGPWLACFAGSYSSMIRTVDVAVDVA